MKHRTTLFSVALLILAACDQPAPTSAPPLSPDRVAAAQVPTWRVPGDFATIQDAVNSPDVQDGDQIILGPGSHTGVLLSKSLHFVGTGGASIDDGPLHPAGITMGFGLMAGSEGSSFEHLTFTTALAIITRDADVDDVTVAHNTFLNALQAVSAWRGNGWNIHHNDIIDLHTRCGGGIGILIGHFTGGTTENHVISHNKISGTLFVADGDCGGYSGTGIVIFADFRSGRTGADEIRNNQVTSNTVSLVSDNPGLVDAIAFEMTDTRDDDILGPLTIFNNAIGFNDFRGTASQIVLTPSNLDAVNILSRNLGDSRGKGLHPSVLH